MKALMIVAPEMFRDEEYAGPKAVLEAAGIATVTASSNAGTASGRFGLKAKIDLTLDKVKASDYDAAIFVGGPGSHDYFDDPEALRIAKEAAGGKVIASICSAGGILANAGVLKGRKATVFPTEVPLIKSKGAIYTDTGVVTDGNLITADGPQNATKFGEAIVKALTDGKR
ncbi:MAG TPA: DJ-1/PfpI family protein [Candidatus Omnitrophota bacterium]|nr:DJ-1/PfpI family protein [Candidatus Omnitrophota bacterium]